MYQDDARHRAVTPFPVVVDSLADVAAERDVVLRLAGHLAAVAAEAAARVDHPAVALAVLGCGHALAPGLFGEEEGVVLFG